MKSIGVRDASLLLGLLVFANPGMAREQANDRRPNTPKPVAKSAVFYMPPKTKVIDKNARVVNQKGSWLVRKGASLDLTICTGICFLESGATLTDAGEVEILVVKKGGLLPDINGYRVHIYCEKGTRLPERLPHLVQVEEFDSISFAPWRPFVLKGRVSEVGGKTRAGIKVHGYGLDEQPIAEAVTDNEGAFELRPAQQVKCLAADLGEAWYKQPSFQKAADLELRQRLHDLRGWEAEIREDYWGRDTNVSLTQTRPAALTLPRPAVLLAHERAVRELVFSGNGATLATVSDAGWPCLWDSKTGAELQRFTPHLLTSEAEAQRVSHYPAAPWLLALGPRGKLLACFGPDSRLGLWDGRTGRQLWERKGHKGVVRCAVFSPDGRTLASGGADGTVHLWDIPAGQTRGVIKAHKARVDALVYSPDGKTLLSIGAVEGDYPNDSSNAYDAMRVWNAATGAAARAFDKPCERAVFSSDGELLAAVSVSGEGAPSCLLIWGKGRDRWIAKMPAQAAALAFTPDGQLLLTATGKGVRVWEVATGQEVLTCPLPEKEVGRLAFSPDSRTLTVGRPDGTISRWSVRPSRLYVPEPRPRSAAEWKQLWTDLAGAKATTAYRALWTLRREPPRAVTLLRGQLVPARELPLDKWIEELDSSQFTTRAAASKSLRDSGEPAERALRHLLKSKSSLEVRKRAEQIIAEIEQGRPSAEELRSRRAIQLLEEIGSAEACRLLQGLAKGWKEARQTREAKAALKRLHGESRVAKDTD